MIGINAKAALQQPRTGLEEYTYQLISHLISQAQSRGLASQMLLYVPAWRHMPQEFLAVPIRVISAPFMWTQLRLAAELAWQTPSVFFNTEQILPLFAPKRSVVTVHDLAYEIFPREYAPRHRAYLQFVTRHAVHKAKKIIAVSERTKRDISKYYAVPQRKIEVIYHGFMHNQLKDPEDVAHDINARKLLPTHNPYFLFVGRLEKKKNIVRLIEAFEYFCARTKEPFDLVLAGAPGFGYEQIAYAIKHSPYASRIHESGYVSPEVKTVLYTHAFAFVFISLYEGFGLPVLEAQNAGIPVIASDTSSIPEVVGKAGIMVDPQDPVAVAKAMEDLLVHKKLRPYLIKKGYENLERFSWKQSAQQTLDLLLSV